MCDTESGGGRKINRRREDGAKQRRIRKTLGKTNWYRTKKTFNSSLREGERKQFSCEAPMTKEVKNCSRKGKGIDKEVKETEAVIFVPCTPGGALQRLLQNEEDRFTEKTRLKRIRIVERGGTKLTDLLITSDPWEKERCERTNCLPCQGSEDKPRINCQKENITYCIRCKECSK